MQHIQVKTSMPSDVCCGAGAADRLAEILKEKEVFVLTDENVYRLYQDFISRTLPNASVKVIAAGEKHKNRRTLFEIIDAMMSARLHRNSWLVALGGGVVGDMGGLAASLYMRGIGALQVPTTLLAQVDSSVGGKTAIDHGGVKNVIGTFYQPRYVLCDPMFLKTLPPREIKCGLGEIIKTAALDSNIYEKICQNAQRIYDLDFLSEITADCIRFKAKIVGEDETEKSGKRKCLNMGHTTGHALELRYGRRSHGEYVLIGMWLESFIAEEEGVCTHEYAENIRTLISLAEKKIPLFKDAESAAEVAVLDKKNEDGKCVSLILPKTYGEYKELFLSIDKYKKYLDRLSGAER